MASLALEADRLRYALCREQQLRRTLEAELMSQRDFGEGGGASPLGGLEAALVAWGQQSDELLSRMIRGSSAPDKDAFGEAGEEVQEPAVAPLGESLEEALLAWGRETKPFATGMKAECAPELAQAILNLLS